MVGNGKPERQSSVTSQFSLLLAQPEFEIRLDCSLIMQFQLVVYLLIELLNSMRKRVKLHSQSQRQHTRIKAIFKKKFYVILPAPLKHQLKNYSSRLKALQNVIHNLR